MPWIHERRADTSNPIADQDYYLDAEGNVTTDSAEAHIQIASKGSPIAKDVREKYSIPTAPEEEKVAQKDEEAEKPKPSANKKATPSKNKGAK